MWHRVLLVAIFVIVLDADPGVYSEGGDIEDVEQVEMDEGYLKERAAEILAELERHPPVLSAQIEGQSDDGNDIPEAQADIVQQQQQNDKVQPQPIRNGEPEQPLPSAMPVDKPQPKLEKKGQNEFVEFVEPNSRESYQLKNGQTLDKRVSASSNVYTNTGPQNMLQTGNLLFLAVVTVCVVASVVGVVGGGIYWHGLQKQRAAAEAAEYPHYAPTGPLARGKVRQRGVAPMGDKANAYNAQLHHYQQTKAKIISGDGVMPHRAPEAEESDEEEDVNNFSVYECPGLAPTGDIEVNNPNYFETSR